MIYTFLHYLGDKWCYPLLCVFFALWDDYHSLWDCEKQPGCGFCMVVFWVFDCMFCVLHYDICLWSDSGLLLLSFRFASPTICSWHIQQCVALWWSFYLGGSLLLALGVWISYLWSVALGSTFARIHLQHPHLCILLEGMLHCHTSELDNQSHMLHVRLLFLIYLLF